MFYVIESITKSKKRFIVNRKCIRENGKLCLDLVYKCYIPEDYSQIPGDGISRVKPDSSEPSKNSYYKMKLVAIKGKNKYFFWI